ncbi:NACHT domain-containing protein [Actinokineospora bangkokensis]|uniref:NACHT domain-containing protein n=1 Tax=Actinokineospora bangkokensis TaxID=1193682 RepID=A0A1Q9LT40_9PSEU|nr:NACHT domain-containing protein [Actinokineospora bangkokensis]OLR95169.1 hypothetical protein BJP25_07670 [Actinokineospora bangkokensis]
MHIDLGTPTGYLLAALAAVVVWEAVKPHLHKAKSLTPSRALTTYRAALHRAYARPAIAYLPPPITRDPAVGPLDVRALDQHTVITGPPGAGKTTHLRRILATWTGGPAPVLLDLGALAGPPERTWREHITARLGADGHPNPGPFARRALAGRGLTVLLDGYDDLPAELRPRVVQSIRAFATRYPRCKLVVASRSDAPILDGATTTAVPPLTDAEIRRFCAGIKDPDLLKPLRDNPRALRLVRTPLLLSLYAAYPEAPAPTSRAAFYTRVLKARLDECPDPGATLDVLIGHALGGPAPDDDAAGLLAPGGGFAVPGLRDHLAALGLRADRDGLVERYKADPDGTRDTVLSWCGAVGTQAGPLIEDVFALDPVLALECLPEARTLDIAVADRITDHFRATLAPDTDPRVLRALGGLAADPRPRGQVVLAFLITAAQGGNPAACHALAASGLPRAAKLLADRRHLTTLATMGDAAVPALLGVLDRPDPLPVVDALAATPSAVPVLVGLLDRDDLAQRAAEHLAAVPDLPPEVAERVARVLGTPEVEPAARRRRARWPLRALVTAMALVTAGEAVGGALLVGADWLGLLLVLLVVLASVVEAVAMAGRPRTGPLAAFLVPVVAAAPYAGPWVSAGTALVLVALAAVAIRTSRRRAPGPPPGAVPERAPQARAGQAKAPTAR